MYEDDKVLSYVFDRNSRNGLERLTQYCDLLALHTDVPTSRVHKYLLRRVFQQGCPFTSAIK